MNSSTFARVCVLVKSDDGDTNEKKAALPQ